MITHYLPRWLLSNFRAEGLFELNKHTNSIDRRSLDNAGSGADLWPAEVEKTLMGTHDNRAWQIYRSRIKGRRTRIELEQRERFEFSQWLALLRPRVPQTFQDIKGMLAEALGNPQIGVSLMRENRARVLQIIRERNPELYDEFTADFGLGLAEELLLELACDYVAQGKIKWIPSAEETYRVHLETTPIDDFARSLCRYQWVWLYSRHGFIIGDNPLLRWHKRSHRWNYGIRRPGVEITVPLSTHLCLLMRKRHRRYDGRLINCGRSFTQELNLRQRRAAETFLYGESAALLNPQAKYGFL